MKLIYPDLWQTDAEHPFGPGMSTHAYLLTRSGGNVLFYSTGLDDEHEEMAARGGVARQYLSHRDEAGPPLARIRARFGSKLCCHEHEADAIGRYAQIDLKFAEREVHLGDIELIPTPGHTPGSACFLVRSAHGGAYLFTGDSLFPRNGGWGTYVSRENSPTAARSLEALRGLAPTVVISSASVGPDALREVSPSAWQAALDEGIRSLS